MAQDRKHGNKHPLGSNTTCPDNGHLEATLPIEILDLIVDELGPTAHQDSSREALRALALVSTTLCQRAYKHLFSELNLILSDDIDEHLDVSLATCRRTLKRLHHLLSCGLEFPGIAMVYHLRGMQISIDFYNRQDVQAMTLLPELSGILDALHGAHHGITHLGIDVQTGWHTTPDPEFPIHISRETNSRLFDAFVSLCRSPNFTTLRLKNVSMESKALCGTDIQSLHLDQFMLEDHHDQPSRLSPKTRADSTTSILQPVSLTLLNILVGTLENTKKPTDLFTDLVGFFHPSHDINKAIARPLVYANLTSLTIQDRDTTTQIEFLPQLRSLKVRQSIQSGRRNFGLKSDLPRFFIPRPGAVRNLGSVVNLTIETETFNHPDSVMDDPRIEDAWEVVDLHLAKTINCLEYVQLDFVIPPQVTYEWSTEEIASLVAKTKKRVPGFFPRLSALEELPVFSVNVFVTEDDYEKKHSTVRCKGLETGWW